MRIETCYMFVKQQFIDLLFLSSCITKIQIKITTQWQILQNCKYMWKKRALELGNSITLSLIIISAQNGRSPKLGKVIKCRSYGEQDI